MMNRPEKTQAAGKPAGARPADMAAKENHPAPPPVLALLEYARPVHGQPVIV